MSHLARPTADVPTPLRHQPLPQSPQRATGQIRPANAYHAGKRVWVWHAGKWKPGVALLHGGHGLLVRYRYGDDAGTTVDTVPAAKIRARAEDDPAFDRQAVRHRQLTVPDPTLRRFNEDRPGRASATAPTLARRVAENRALRGENTELRGRLGLNSTNSRSHRRRMT